jgi:CRISPR/Cas system-associated endonuclease Cas1
MLKRTLFFGSSGKLSIKNTLLQYEPRQEGEIRKFPLEDLGCLVIESLQMVVTTQDIFAELIMYMELRFAQVIVSTNQH